MIAINGEKVTPKFLAEDVLALAIFSRMEFLGEYLDSYDLTERERKLVVDQTEKIADRLLKVLHYKPQYRNGGNDASA